MQSRVGAQEKAGRSGKSSLRRQTKKRRLEGREGGIEQMSGGRIFRTEEQPRQRAWVKNVPVPTEKKNNNNYKSVFPAH